MAFFFIALIKPAADVMVGQNRDQVGFYLCADF
jgi:hypothetical protein